MTGDHGETQDGVRVAEPRTIRHLLILATSALVLLSGCAAGDPPSGANGGTSAASMPPSVAAPPSASTPALDESAEPSPTPAWEEIDLPPVEDLGDRLLAAIDLPGGVCDLTASDTSIWATIRGEGRLIEIDAATNEVLRQIDFEDGACAVAWADGSVWVAKHQDLIQHIDRIDPLSGEVIGTIDFRLASSIFAMEAGPGGLWVLNRQRSELYLVDTATTEIAETFEVGYGASDMEVTDAVIWTTSDVVGGLLGLDPESGETSVAPVDFPSGVAVDKRGLWAYIPIHHQLTLIDPVTLEQLVALRFELETGSPETAAGAIWLPAEEGLLLAFHSGTATPGAVFAIPERIDTAKEALGDLWLYGSVRGLLRVEPGDIQPGEIIKAGGPHLW
jgi:hypothetical protein